MIEGIAYAIAALGALLVLLLVQRLLQVDAELKLKSTAPKMRASQIC